MAKNTRFLVFFLTLLLALALPSGLSAKDNRFRAPNVGLSLNVPANWYATTIEMMTPGMDSAGKVVILADSMMTLWQLVPDVTFVSGQYTLYIFPPRAVALIGEGFEQITATVFEGKSDLEALTIDGRQAQRWSYRNAHTEGFSIVFELPDGSVTMAVADTAPSEMNEREAEIMAVLASVTRILCVSSDGEPLELVNTAAMDELPFTFDYPEDWYVVLGSYPHSTVLSNTQAGLNARGYSDSPVLLIVEEEIAEVLPQSIIDNGLKMADIVQAYAYVARRQGETTRTPRVMDIDGIETGYLEYTSTGLLMLIRVLDEQHLVRMYAFVPNDELRLFKPTLFAIYASIQPLTVSTAAFGELTETYVSKIGISFQYPAGWSVMEAGGLILFANTPEVEQFKAREGEYLGIISTTDYMSREDATALIIARKPKFNDEFDLNALRIDAEQSFGALALDAGTAGVDFEYNAYFQPVPDASRVAAVFLVFDAAAVSDPMIPMMLGQFSRSIKVVTSGT